LQFHLTGKNNLRSSIVFSSSEMDDERSNDDDNGGEVSDQAAAAAPPDILPVEEEDHERNPPPPVVPVHAEAVSILQLHRAPPNANFHGSATSSSSCAVSASNQSLLRQQAHSPVSNATHGLEVSARSFQGGYRRSYEAPFQQLAFSDTSPELDMEDPNASEQSSGWSDVAHSQDHGNGGVPPSPRSLHAGALLNGNFYTFGGYDGNQRVNTFHAFSFAEKRWSPVFPSANSSPPPTPRDRHVAVAFGNAFYVHGGFDGTSRVADFWAFDFSTMSWREVVALQGRHPSPRHSHAAVVHGHSMYIFGGYDGSYKSDLHEFDFTTSRWNAVPAVGRRPRARYRATCVVHKNSMILYGGHDGTRHLSDTHVFDIDTKTWAILLTEGAPPVPRDSHVSVIHMNSMYVFGGSTGSAMNDLHELQLPSSSSMSAKWRSINASHAEQPRHRFCHVAVVHSDAMFVFGGYDGSDRLNDFIRFDFTVYDLSFEVPQSTLIADFRSMINDVTLSDVSFIVEGRDSPIYAHKLMLVRCPYFESLFLGSMRESRQATIYIEQVSYPIFLATLEYLYTDHVSISLKNAMELFEAADLFCIPRLKTMCEKRMLQSITVENAAGIFLAADMHSASALRQKVKKFILSNFEEVSKSSCFEEMGRSNIELVFELLQSR
jgi:hypothetical protein